MTKTEQTAAAGPRRGVAGRITSSEGRLPSGARASSDDQARFSRRVNELYGSTTTSERRAG